MKIRNTSPQIAEQKNNSSFKGLWGKATYLYTKNIYDGEYECSYHRIPYHPCKDEPESVVKQTLAEKQKELDKYNKYEEHYTSGDYYSAEKGEPLNITTDELIKLKRDCQKILDNTMPINNINLVI